MPMQNSIRVTPISPQVRYRSTFFPPNYNLVKQDVGIALATKITEVLHLRSSTLIFNQNNMSAQYLSFRYVYPNEPMRYFDVSIGIDQADLLFFSPATAAELKEGVLKIWEPLLEKSKPNITENYFEATFHSVAEDSANVNSFLDQFVKIQTARTDFYKGFSLTVNHPEVMGDARLTIERSNANPAGLYLAFAAVSKNKVKDINSLASLIDKAISIYRDIQGLAQIEVVEPE
jgi:hypothetical protein